MSLQVHLHDINRVSVNEFQHNGAACASITFRSDSGEIKLFVSPHAAHAIKGAWNNSVHAAAAYPNTMTHHDN